MGGEGGHSGKIPVCPVEFSWLDSTCSSNPTSTNHSFFLGKTTCRPVEVGQDALWTMMFADDTVNCGEIGKQVEENLEWWRFALEKEG